MAAHRSNSAHRHDHEPGAQQVQRLVDDGVAFAPITDTAIHILRRIIPNPTAIVDLGSGPGIGTGALAEAFPGAHITAVDTSNEMLAATRRSIDKLGLDDRVTTLQAQLPTDVGALPTADVYWSSMTLHHVGDEVALLQALRQRLGSGGVLVALEWSASPRPVLVHPGGTHDPDLGRPGLANRVDTAGAEWFAEMRSGLPDFMASASYPTMMAEAGFDVVHADTIELTIAAPLPDELRARAIRWLMGLSERLAPFASITDRSAIDSLASDPDAEGRRRLERDDIAIFTARTLTIGRAP